MERSDQSPDFPAPHRLHWRRPDGSSFKLFYLTWGHRFYGRKPSPFVRAKLWCYTVIRQGNPILKLASGEVPLRARDVCIVAPGCLHALRDCGDSRSDVLGWQWETPPGCQDVIPKRKGFLRWRANLEVLRHLQQIHADCRQEVFYSDEWTPLALEHLRLALDVTLARSCKMHPLPSQQEEPWTLAVRWMQEHLQVVNPVHHICDYLQVSPSTLRRLFLDHLGHSPAAHFQQLKMERALEMLQYLSVKEVAYRLGYRYPNDFSKAFKDHFGVSPTARPHSVAFRGSPGHPSSARPARLARR